MVAGAILSREFNKLALLPECLFELLWLPSKELVFLRVPSLSRALSLLRDPLYGEILRSLQPLDSRRHIVRP